jgi:ADP-heptose:LPS heptosyltransferase
VIHGRPSLLVLRALGLGDLLTSVPAIRALRRAYPDHLLTLATPGFLEPIVDLVGGIDRILDSKPLEIPRLRRPDVAVNLHGRGPESHRCLLATEPRRLIAFGHPAVSQSVGSPIWCDEEHEVARWCRLLTESSIPSDRTDLAICSPGPARGLDGVTVIHPGAGSRARQWPADRWSAVARDLAARGQRVVVTGDPSERALARRVARGAGSGVESLAGSTGLEALARIVSGARLVLSGDTGIAHLAIALGTPSVTLFGPTPPSLWGPPPGRPQHRVLWRGKRGDPHAARPDPGLLAISADEVIEEVALALDGSYPRRRDRRRRNVGAVGAVGRRRGGGDPPRVRTSP